VAAGATEGREWMTRVAFVGLGAMGGRLVRRLLDAGHEIIIWNRTVGKTAPFVHAGAALAESPAAAAAQADAVITMVSDPPALRAVVEGPDGIAEGAGPSVTLIEMSTMGPAAIAQLPSILPEGTGLLDAPVLGSLAEAESGSLHIFVGGEDALVQRWTPLLSVFGTPLHVGRLGAGSAAKLVANATVLGVVTLLGEAIALADGLGLKPKTAFEVLATTPLSEQADRRRQAIQDGMFAPRYRLSLAGKDARLIRQAAETAGIQLRIAEAVRAWFTDAELAGWGDHDYTAVLATILGRGFQGGKPPHEKAWEAVPQRPLAYDGMVIDLDGVVWLAGYPIEGAAEAIAHLRASGTQVLFLTNDPQRSREGYAARLRAMGIPTTAAQVLTSTAAMARFLASQEELAGGQVLAIGSGALRDELSNAGVRLAPMAEPERARAVVVGGHEGFNYEELRAATTAVVAGAKLYATGRDAVYPSKDGPRPGTGAILAAVETATGVRAAVIGKPEPYIFQIAREELSGCEHVAVVGDHLESDIAGAKRAGLDAILVLTGIATEVDLLGATIRPDAVLPSLASLSNLDLRSQP
jgi:HAD superfamily hydrolase (TIGR01450 family)